MNKEVVCEFETNTTSTFGKFEVQLYISNPLINNCGDNFKHWSEYRH